MVDVTAKSVVVRSARASGAIFLETETIRLIQADRVAKGNVLAVARLAGIMAAKKTGELIPLAHPLPLTYAEIEFEFPDSLDRIRIGSLVRTASRTGVEMEALTAVAVAALTVYDMCKSKDKTMRVGEIQLDAKEKIPPA